MAAWGAFFLVLKLGGTSEKNHPVDVHCISFDMSIPDSCVVLHSSGWTGLVPVLEYKNIKEGGR